MRAVYDLSCCPPQWDFANALATFEAERVRRGDRYIELVFLLTAEGGFRESGVWPTDKAGRSAAFGKIARPLVQLLPSVSIIHVSDHRAAYADDFGFADKPFLMARWVAALASGHGRAFALREPVGLHPRRITMTLREAGHWPERNSDVAAWQGAAEILRRDGYEVIIVRDTAKADEPLGQLPTAPAASRDVAARFRLYAGSALNLFVPNGPMTLALFGNLPMAVLRPICPTHRASTPEYMAASGWAPYGDLPNAPPWQRHVWAPDTVENIVETVRAMVPLPRAVAQVVA